MRKQYKVIRVADVVFGFELVLNKLVKLIHINIDQQL